MTITDNPKSQLNKLLDVVIRQKIPFASYRLPDEKDVITIVQHHGEVATITPNTQFHEKQGFVISPFDNKQNSGFLLNPDCVYFNDDIDDIFIQKLSNNTTFINLKKNNPVTFETSTLEEYTGNVSQAVECIKNGEFNKVVISKIQKNKLPENFNPPRFYENLRKKYPHAMVYLLQIPGVGFWAGATPEPLLVHEQDKIRTVSLAGTQIAAGKKIQDYVWSSKEIEEQGIVTKFVEDSLIQSGIKDFIKNGPSNEQAGNLIHLKTAFEFSEKDLNISLNDLLNKLHPTPSVGGLPKAEAFDFITRHEKHYRTFYSGYLGPVNIQDKTNIFVNLRCVQLFDKEFVLYSGAGITASSIPEKEWEETENKMKTMLNVFIPPNIKKNHENSQCNDKI